MPFTLFHDRFRDLAERETRAITVFDDSGHGVPAGAGPQSPPDAAGRGRRP